MPHTDTGLSKRMLPLALLGALALAPLAGETRERCRDGWVCIDEWRSATGVEIAARNLRPYPVTVTVRVDGRGYRHGRRRIVTETVPPASTRRIMGLRREPGRAAEYRLWFDWTIGDREAVHDDDYLYTLPYAPGKSYHVLQGYGSRFSHTGLEQYAVDFFMPEGTPVHAARDGIVARVEESHDRGCWKDGCWRYANYIVVLHADGTTGEYYHLQQDGALVEPGDEVRAGQKIGLSGNTGHTTMPHLHFAVYRASSWGNTQSIPVRFASLAGIISRPRQGGRYLAAHGGSHGDSQGDAQGGSQGGSRGDPRADSRGLSGRAPASQQASHAAAP